MAKFFDRARGVSKPGERDALGQDVSDFLATTKQQRAGLSWNETNQKKVLDGDIAAAQRLLAALDKITDEQLKQRDLAKAKADIDAADAAHAEEQAQNLAQLDKYKQARGEAFYDREQADQTRLAIEQSMQAADKGEGSDAIARRRRELQDFLQKNPAITDQSAPAADVQRRDEVRDNAQEQIKALDEAEAKSAEVVAHAREQAAAEENQRQIKDLQDQLQLLEAQHALRMAEIERAGGAESDILKKRKTAEDDFARDRLTLEDQIAARQGEHASGTMARHVQAQADAVERQNEVDQAARQKQADAWDAGKPREGTIDARTQNVVAMGQVYEHQGQLEGGATRDAMGAIESPSMLGQMHGAGWDEPRRMADLMPPADKPGAGTPSNGQSADPTRSAGDAAKAMHDLTTKLQASLQQLVQEARQANGALTPAITAITTEMRQMTQQLRQVQSQIRSLGSR
jgi:hypothetical protein